MNRQPIRPSAPDLLNLHFIENRARVLELAAFLDRLDRGEGAGQAREEHRYKALLGMVQQLLSEQGNRVEKILLSLSDRTDQPAEVTPCRPVTGAWSGCDAD